MYKKMENYMNYLPDKARYGSISLENTRMVEFCINNGVVTIEKNGYINGGNIRFSENNAWNFTSFTDITDIDYRFNKSIQCKKNENQNIFLAKTEVVRGDYRVGHKEVIKIDILNTINILKEYCEKIKNKYQEVCSVKCGYKQIYTEKHFANNEGTLIAHDILDASFYMQIDASQKLESIKTIFSDGGSDIFTLLYNREEDIFNFCDNTINLLYNKDKGKTCDSNHFQEVILDQDIVATLIHEVVGHLSEADSYINFNHLERGYLIANNLLNVYDTPKIGSRGYSMFDDEGTKCHKLNLITNGKINGRLHTRQTAFKYNEEALGNARSLNYRYTPLCRMRHTSVENGELNFGDSLATIKKGIYLIGSKGGYCGENFSIRSSFGRVIINGKFERCLDNINLFGNIYEVLHNITGICNDKKVINKYGGCGKLNQYPLAVSYSAPTMILRGGVKISIG